MVFAAITGLTAIALIVIGIQLWRGNISLVHSYHRVYVNDHAGYGKAMGISTFVLSGFLLLACLLALLWPRELVAVVAVMAGLVVYGILVGRTQAKYNKK